MTAPRPVHLAEPLVATRFGGERRALDVPDNWIITYYETKGQQGVRRPVAMEKAPPGVRID